MNQFDYFCSIVTYCVLLLTKGRPWLSSDFQLALPLLQHFCCQCLRHSGLLSVLQKLLHVMLRYYYDIHMLFDQTNTRALAGWYSICIFVYIFVFVYLYLYSIVVYRQLHFLTAGQRICSLLEGILRATNSLNNNKIIIILINSRWYFELTEVKYIIAVE